MLAACHASRSFTAHALSRCAQRAIPPHAVEMLIDYGASTRVRGADSYFLDRAGRSRLREDLGGKRFRSVERWLNAYAVVGDDGRVITAAWRTRRLRQA